MATQTTTRTSRPRHRYLRPIPPDPIDVLDTTSPGGFYHHDGPYDAALRSRNMHPKTSPLAAVHDSNKAALDATPREFIVDSLEKNVPLQGTSSVPPGGRDFGGAVMRYEDGSDMMRDGESEGGAYKRWAHITYHPNDLKGKGEPSYSIEEAEKARHRKLSKASSGADSYEMRAYPGSPPPRTSKKGKRRSVSDVPRHTGSSALPKETKGLRRRLGDLSRKGS